MVFARNAPAPSAKGNDILLQVKQQSCLVVGGGGSSSIWRGVRNLAEVSSDDGGGSSLLVNIPRAISQLNHNNPKLDFGWRSVRSHLFSDRPKIARIHH